jgi:hypothetical protein
MRGLGNASRWYEYTGESECRSFYVLFITVFFCTKEFSSNLILRCAICRAQEYLAGAVELHAIAYYFVRSLKLRSVRPRPNLLIHR